MKQIILKSGLVLGLLNVLWLYAEFIAGLHSIKNIDLFFKITPLALLIPVGIVISYIHLRKQGHLRRKYPTRAFAGTYISLIMAMISVVGQFTYHVFINPGYLSVMIEHAKSKGAQNPEAFFNIPSYLGQVFLSNLFIGVVVSMTLAIFFKNPISSNNNKD